MCATTSPSTFLGHGRSTPAEGQSLTFTDQAEMIAQFLDAMDIESVDLIASDSGTVIAQILAVRHPERVRSLVVTNRDVHDNWPPSAFEDFTVRVAAGELPDILQQFHDDHDAYGGPEGIGRAYQRPENVTDEEIDVYIEPLATIPGRSGALARFISAFDNRHTTALADRLAELRIPTLIIWGTGDIFFDPTGARCLADTLPEACEPVILDNGALLLPSERFREVNTSIGVFGMVSSRRYAGDDASHSRDRFWMQSRSAS